MKWLNETVAESNVNGSNMFLMRNLVNDTETETFMVQFILLCSVALCIANNINNVLKFLYQNVWC